MNSDVRILVLGGRSEAPVFNIQLLQKLFILGQVSPTAVLCGNVGRRLAEALGNLWRVSRTLAHHNMISAISTTCARLERRALGTKSVPASAFVW